MAGGDLPEAAADPPLTGGAPLRRVAAAGRPCHDRRHGHHRHLSRRQLRPDLRGDHGDRARRYRHDPRRARRAPDPQRPQPDRRWSPRCSLVHGHRYGARRAPARREGRLVSQPLRRLGPSRRSDRQADHARPAFPRLRGHRQHQRDRPRRHDPRRRRSRRAGDVAHRRSGHGREHRLQRHPRRIVLRSSQG